MNSIRSYDTSYRLGLRIDLAQSLDQPVELSHLALAEVLIELADDLIPSLLWADGEIMLIRLYLQGFFGWLDIPPLDNFFSLDSLGID